MAKSSRPMQPDSVRIIGGSWRGTKLPVLEANGLRPTGDRIRETLFNWLAADIHGATCVDLFAGTGALGLEALSRGATKSFAIEQNPKVRKQLLAIKEKLKAQNYEVVDAEALEWFASCSVGIDILFLDPPFAERYWDRLSQHVEASSCFNKGAMLYLEQQHQCEPWRVPAGWQMKKSRTAGEVRYELYEYIG